MRAMIRLHPIRLLPVAIALALIDGCAGIHHPNDSIALPTGIAIETPGADVPSAYAAYVGAWDQEDINHRDCVLAITGLDLPRVTAFYRCERYRWIPLDGGFPLAAHGALILHTPWEITLRLRRRSDRELTGSFGWDDVTFTKTARTLE